MAPKQCQHGCHIVIPSVANEVSEVEGRLHVSSQAVANEVSEVEGRLHVSSRA